MLVVDKRDIPMNRITFPSTPSSASDFRRGFAAPLTAAAYLFRRPYLWKYTLIGGLVTMLIFAGLATVGIANADNLAAHLWTSPETGFGAVLGWGIVFLAGLVLLGAAAVLALVLSQIVMAPLYTRLSERVEDAILQDASEYQSTASESLMDEVRGVAHSLLTLTILCCVMVPILLLNVIPGIGSVASVLLGGLVSSFALAVEFTDSSLSRRRAKWREKVGHATSQLPVTMGLGAGIAVTMAIPVLSFFLVPVAVVAGTMVFCGLSESNRVHVRDRRNRKGDLAPNGNIEKPQQAD
ncbi:MAG: CysZ protein [Bradymonadia bacterium]